MYGVPIYTAIVWLLLGTADPQVGPKVSIGSIEQKAPCSAAGVIGDVTLNCPNEDPKVVEILTKVFVKQLHDKDVRIEELTKDVNVWRTKYEELQGRVASSSLDEEARQRVAKLLAEGKLKEAGTILLELITNGEPKVDQVAKDHYDLGALLALQFMPSEAESHLEKAYRYRPDDPLYAEGYAEVLQLNHKYKEAEPIYWKVLAIRREQDSKNFQTYAPREAEVLSNLGALHRDLQEWPDAYNALVSAQVLYQKLAKIDRQKYLPDVAMTVVGMGLLDYHQGNFDAAGSEFASALEIFEQFRLETKDKQANDRAIAMVWNNLGILLHTMGGLEKSAQAYSNALNIYLELERDHSLTNQPDDIARMESALGWVYIQLRKYKDAGILFKDSVARYELLARQNTQLYLAAFVSTFNHLGLAYREDGRDPTELCKQADTLATEFWFDEKSRSFKDVCLALR